MMDIVNKDSFSLTSLQWEQISQRKSGNARLAWEEMCLWEGPLCFGQHLLSSLQKYNFHGYFLLSEHWTKNACTPLWWPAELYFTCAGLYGLLPSVQEAKTRFYWLLKDSFGFHPKWAIIAKEEEGRLIPVSRYKKYEDWKDHEEYGGLMWNHE